MASVSFDDPVLDELYAKQARTIDKTVRLRLVRQFEARVTQQSYVLPILWWRQIVVPNSAVQGWTMSPSNMIYQNLADLWLTSA